MSSVVTLAGGGRQSDPSPHPGRYHRLCLWPGVVVLSPPAVPRMQRLPLLGCQQVLHSVRGLRLFGVAPFLGEINGFLYSVGIGVNRGALGLPL